MRPADVGAPQLDPGLLPDPADLTQVGEADRRREDSQWNCNDDGEVGSVKKSFILSASWHIM